LHTGRFAESFGKLPQQENELEILIIAANAANASGLKVNAGHGLNYQNLKLLFKVPHLVELNIGHSIISRSIFVGIEQAVKEMLDLMKGYLF